MENLELIREQIKLAYPACVLDNNSNSDTIISLILKPFGKLTMDDKLNIIASYHNPFSVDFEYFKNFFELRLKFENASTYIYEDRISIFKRKGNDHTKTVFENSILRANYFIATAKAIEDFIKYNT